MPALSFDSLIFDLDGTLWDASATVAQAMQAAVNQVSYVQATITPAVVQSVTGRPYREVYEQLFPELPAARVAEFQALCSAQELAYAREYGGTLYPEAEATLRYLAARYRLFIVSNCQQGYLDAFLAYTQLGHYFEGHQCFSTRQQPKADNIRDVVQQYDLQAPAYIGDTPGDLEASRAAGVPFIFAAYGFGRLTPEQAPLRIETLAELRQLLQLGRT